MDPRLYRAHTARAACAAGQFHLLGRKLRVFSACHSVLLAALKVPVFSPEDLDLTALEIISLTCSQRMPTGDLSGMREDFSAFDLEAENDKLDAWLFLCYASRPALRNLVTGNGGTWEGRMPMEKYMIASILQHSQGYARDALWYDYPLAELHWEFELMREVRAEQAYITIGGEPEAEDSPEEKADEDRYLAISTKIIARHLAALAKLGQPGSAAYKAAAAQFNAEKADLLALARAGRLTPDLVIIPRPEDEQ